jgi:hypothetical protein
MSWASTPPLAPPRWRRGESDSLPPSTGEGLGMGVGKRIFTNTKFSYHENLPILLSTSYSPHSSQKGIFL